MATGYTTTYLNWRAEYAWNGAHRPATFRVFLYNDSEDDPDLTAESDLSWLTTEPGGLNRPQFEFGNTTVTTDGNRVKTNFGDAVFELGGVTGTVDAYGVEFATDDGTLFVGSGLLNEGTDLGDYTGTWSVDVGVADYSTF